MGILANENAISSGNYIISNSLRFQSASTTYATRTPSVASNRQTWTWSGWVKRGSLGSTQRIFEVNTNTPNNQTCIRFETADTISIFAVDSTTTTAILTTTQVFRDPSAWYHIVALFDTTNATAANRIRLYINGIQVTAFSTATYPTQNYLGWFNSTNAHYFGTAGVASIGAENFDGYLSEVNFIDGQALTPSSFGTTDPTSGQWVAAKYTGTYGTNGFYLPFSNGTSTTTLGADSSGNGNNWTLTNFTRSAGVSDCWMKDVPSGNGGATGTQPNSNYCVGNPLNNTASGNITFSGANLNLTIGVSGQWRAAAATFSMSSGKWYWEVTKTNTTTSADAAVGIISDDTNISGNYFIGQGLYGYAYADNGNRYNQNNPIAYGATWTNGDVIGIAYDADTNGLTFYKNGVSQGFAYTTTSGKSYYPAFGGATTIPSYALNFGQRSFAYTPPSGFKALCTANLPVATIKQGNKYMDATTYSGNLVGQSITNAGSFKPDLVWVKSRSAATDNKITDSVRGAQTALVSNSTAAETTDLTGVVSFNTNGFTLGTSTTYNNTGATYVGWQWQAGQGSTSSNTNGSITSTVSVNATAGFSIATFTGTGANATVGHGLGVAPKMIITKTRGVGTWVTYHESLGNTKYVELQSTASATTSSAVWNNTSPTSSVFTVGTGYTGSWVAYCFAEIAGFSKFGSYTGNGSADGPFVYCGFQPKFVLIKSASSAQAWTIKDTSRSPYNTMQQNLYPNLSNAEDVGTTQYLDVTSNGFKLRATDGSMNGSGINYIFMAFATNPFQNSNAF